jgi:glycosyltransferase involved in cell wall biosynthesis
MPGDSMSSGPKVSIVIPVYNGSNYLREAIDSALAQTYKNIEIIVVNDGSQDNGKTEEIAKSYGDKICYFSKNNGGVATALNFGIREMKGEYFSWLSHDDLYLPEKIQVQMDYLRKERRDVIVYSDCNFVDGKSRFIRRVTIDPVEPGDFRYALFVGLLPLHGCTLLIPKTCFEKVGFFNEQLKTSQDCEMWYRMSNEYEFKHIPQALVNSRLHPEQGSRTMGRLSYDESNQLDIQFVTQLFSENIPPSRIFQVVSGLIFKVKLDAAAHALSLGRRKLGNQRFAVRIKAWPNIALYKTLLMLFQGIRFILQIPFIRSIRFRLRLLLRRPGH